ncbi:DUF305 domain-containing protein [Actinoplanes sp. NPDC049681]|uniref:DUF305 domain-containing protein n=1 Tax=Actinoplanes sp. NPDC049681 TaxID=3363905 RepID=UPI003787AA4F
MTPERVHVLRRGPVPAVVAAVAAVLLLLLAACGEAPRPGASAPSPAYNGTDVMFLQMSLAYIDQGDQVVAVAAQRATAPRLRALAAELAGQWRSEGLTMGRWLTGWQQPPSADPTAGAHAGHGDLHSLRPSDIAELTAAKGEQFDRTAVSLLLGHLHNCVEVSRMEAAGGAYPPARALAERMTAARQIQIQRLLALAA